MRQLKPVRSFFCGNSLRHSSHRERALYTVRTAFPQPLRLFPTEASADAFTIALKRAFSNINGPARFFHKCPTTSSSIVKMHLNI
jgi:hypothetical protein